MLASLRQIRFFVAVYEEQSFTAAAEREGATQSGVSQHVKRLEEQLGAPLLVRSGRSVTPTLAGRRYYGECVAALKKLEAASHDIRVTPPEEAELRVGLMPVFIRAVLAPALQRFMAAHPKADIRITEAYSAVLTAQVRRDELDFAIVPASAGEVGLTTSLLLRDREMLIAAKGRTEGRRGGHLEPIHLAAMNPLKIVMPGLQNARRRNVDAYMATNGVEVAQRLQIDTMVGTLEFVAVTDWVAVVPSILLPHELQGQRFDIRPLADPALFAEFVLIEPARRALSPLARRFAEFIREEAERLAVFRPIGDAQPSGAELAARMKNLQPQSLLERKARA